MLLGCSIFDSNKGKISPTSVQTLTNPSNEFQQISDPQPPPPKFGHVTPGLGYRCASLNFAGTPLCLFPLRLLVDDTRPTMYSKTGYVLG